MGQEFKFLSSIQFLENVLKNFLEISRCIQFNHNLNFVEGVSSLFEMCFSSFFSLRHYRLGTWPFI